MAMQFMPGLEATSDALSAEKLRLDIIAQNIAHAHTTKGPDGEVYRRQTVAFQAELERQMGNMGKAEMSGPRISSIHEDDSEGQMLYMPGHPHANEEGMVEMPNVHMSREMVDMMSASRAYEANLTVVKTAREMAQQAMQIGR